MNYYQIFEINENASQDEIKKAYRKLANKFHPDKHQGDLDYETKFKQINNIYKILSDPQKRIQYNKTIEKKETVTFKQNYQNKTTPNNNRNYKKTIYTVLIKAKNSKSFRLFSSYLIVCIIYFIGSLLVNYESNHIDNSNNRDVYEINDSSLNTGDIKFQKSDSIEKPRTQMHKNDTKSEIKSNNTGDIKF